MNNGGNKQKENLKYDITLTPIVKSLKGTFKTQDKINYKKEKAIRLSVKYL